ncbi:MULTISPECIES: lytic transglycosylase domain-containing protein [Caulobacter]|uniref:Soluble lytic murein transglycosylase-like protein n=1 Tax=Caulobacter vibrioides OR37 TaxID=1292034 RepID=R0CYJ1_CAUVI|nr:MULTISPECIES: lytic transglycosylase domain-containing protein [Caulobacter]ENZ81541.1 soluble lytic murein transglycosylase-like protein [Caulobacter vibrioides OR37]MBQ1563349.1 lytic transglycosylase domain-containing protein [Caulobacter sp.]
MGTRGSLLKLWARPLAVISALLLCASALSARAGALEPLSQDDVRYYRAAFAATDRGDFDAAKAAFANIHDRELGGRLAFARIMHPTAYAASYQDLTAWLKAYGNEAGADRIYALALKRKPAGKRVAPPPVPALFVAGEKDPPPADKGRAAREAYYSGDVQKALTLAVAGGERWIAGLASFRLGDSAKAEAYFQQVADDEHEDEWLRAAGAFWAARAASQGGHERQARTLLIQAARAPHTFYGMIAARQLALSGVALADEVEDPIASLITRASYAGPDTASLNRLMQSDPRARRAAALAQIGRWREAGQELRAGLSLAEDENLRADWTTLALALNANAPLNAGRPVRRVGGEDYPLPPLDPIGGFTIDKALVYALVRQESRFDPLAVSNAGAMGLMQVRPIAAADAVGDDKLRSDTSPLFDPAFNLRAGQDYFTWLMDRGLKSPDLLRAVAAYNGGPGTLNKTLAQLGADCDSLLLIESLPFKETRNYVEKVMASYWTYRRLLGAENKTLDAVASGARTVDFRLDPQIATPTSIDQLMGQLTASQ